MNQPSDKRDPRSDEEFALSFLHPMTTNTPEVRELAERLLARATPSAIEPRSATLAAHFVRHAKLAALVQECLDGVVENCIEWNDRARRLLAEDGTSVATSSIEPRPTDDQLSKLFAAYRVFVQRGAPAKDQAELAKRERWAWEHVFGEAPSASEPRKPPEFVPVDFRDWMQSLPPEDTKAIFRRVWDLYEGGTIERGASSASVPSVNVTVKVDNTFRHIERGADADR